MGSNGPAQSAVRVVIKLDRMYVSRSHGSTIGEDVCLL